MRKKKHYHRGRRTKRGGKGRIVSTVVLIVSAFVFCFSAFQLYKIISGYSEGRGEYEDIRALALQGTEDETDDGEHSFRVNFGELMQINSDTVGWIRFYPEPAQINYPVVQGEDNYVYLDKTFSSNENTVGAIFLDVRNGAGFSDRNTVIYGHRMNDNSMFHDLVKYEEQSFWEENPYFYIYTPDGREIAYHIYSAGVVNAASDTYMTQFSSDKEYQDFLDMTKEEAMYETGITPILSDTVVTLSTCTKDSNDDRFVVRGVKESENYIE